MSQYWRCTTCGAILKKGLTQDKIDALLAEGKEITGTATCGKCSSKFDQSEVYSGAFDVDEAELAEMVRKARETRAMQQAQAEAEAAAAQAEPEPEDDYAHDDVPEMDAGGYDDYPEDDEPREDVLAGVEFGAPDLAPDRPDPLAAHRDFLEDLDAGVDLADAASGTLVNYAAVADDEGYPRYIVQPGEIDEFRPESNGAVCCDICARQLDTPEGYLLDVDEVMASPDYIAFVTERWTLNGWLPPEIDADSVGDQVSADLREQAGPMPWLVCENCILMFPLVRREGLVDAARKVREWWPADGRVMTAAATAHAAPAAAVGYEQAAAGYADDDMGDDGDFVDVGGYEDDAGYDDAPPATGGYDSGYGPTADVSEAAAVLRAREPDAWADDADPAFGDDLADDGGYDAVAEGEEPVGGFDSPYDAMDQGWDAVEDDDEVDPAMQTLDASQAQLFRDHTAGAPDAGLNDGYEHEASPYDAPIGDAFDDVDGFVDDADDPAMQTINSNVADIARVRDAAAEAAWGDDDAGIDVLDDEEELDAEPDDPNAAAMDELDKIMLSTPAGGKEDDDDFMDFNPSAMGIDALDDDDLDIGEDDDER